MSPTASPVAAPAATEAEVETSALEWVMFGDGEMSVEGGVRRIAGMQARMQTRKYGGIALKDRISCPYRLSGEIADTTGRAGSNGGYALGVGDFEPVSGSLTGVGLQYDLGADRIHPVEYPADATIEVLADAVGVPDNGRHSFELVTTDEGSEFMIDGVTFNSSSEGQGCRQPFIRAWEDVIEVYGLTLG